MPLHFLTAESDPKAPGAAAPPREPERWRRPYPPGPWRVGAAALLLLLASCLLFSTVLVALAGAAVRAGLCAACAALAVACALRLLRAGVWIGSRGMRRVALFTTTTLPWEDVTAVRTVQRPVRWLGLPCTVQGQALVVDSRGDGAPRTVITDHDADFLGRPEVFDRAADAVEARAAEHRPPGGGGPVDGGPAGTDGPRGTDR